MARLVWMAILMGAAPAAAAAQAGRDAVLQVDPAAAIGERVAGGLVTARCTAGGTTLRFELAGLVPGATYSLWMFVFDRSREALTPADATAAGALGSARAGGHEFRADAQGRADLALVQPAGRLSAFGVVPGCLLDQPAWRVVGAYHPRRVTAGTLRPPAGEAIVHFGVRSTSPAPMATN